MDARDRQARIEIILPDGEAAADLQDATFLIGKDDIGRELGALLERARCDRRDTYHACAPKR